MTHHPLIPLPFNPLPSTRMSPPFPSPLPLFHLPLFHLPLFHLHLFHLPLFHLPLFHLPLFPPSPFHSSPSPLPLLLSPSPFPPSPFPPSPFPPSPFPPHPPYSITLSSPHLYIPATIDSYVSPFPFYSPPSPRNPRLNPSCTPHPNGSNFSMVITISHINYPENHLPRFTPSLFCYLLINFPLSHHFFPTSTPNTSPGVYFDHSLINQFCSFFSQKNTLPTFLPAPTTPIHMPLIIFPPFKISNSANFPLPNITSPHHDFFPPNFTLPTLFTNPPLENSTSNIITAHPPPSMIPLHSLHPFNDITVPPPPHHSSRAHTPHNYMFDDS